MPDDSASRIIAIYNQKGGIAKTTTSVNLALCLTAFGKRVLLIDLDAQGNATKNLGLAGEAPHDLADAIGGRATLDETIAPTIFENLFLVPATMGLSGIEMRMGLELRSQKSLAELITNSTFAFDFILFDCPPAFGLLSANALVAASSVVIPVTPTAFAYDGLKRTLDVVGKIQGGLNKTLRITGILVTLMEQDEVSLHFVSLLRREFNDQIFRPEIPRDREIVKAGLRRLPVVVFNPHAASSKQHLAMTEALLARESGAVARAPAKTARGRKAASEAIEAGVGTIEQALAYLVTLQEKAPPLPADEAASPQFQSAGAPANDEQTDETRSGAFWDRDEIRYGMAALVGFLAGVVMSRLIH
jgi:chromosome partitioning protein